MALEAWPEWSPLFQMVKLHDASVGIAGGFTAHGLIGRIPYRAEFMVPDYKPLHCFVFESVTTSPPYNRVHHDVRLGGNILTWTTAWSTAGGPGGILVDRLLVRRQAGPLVEAQLAALAGKITSGNRVG